MTYEEWLNNIAKLENHNEDALSLLEKQEINQNLHDQIENKLLETTAKIFANTVNNIISSLPNIYTDKYYMDMVLIEFKKNINYILRIINLKQISKEKALVNIEAIKNKVDETYEILEREADIEDPIGELSLIIKNNRIKWSDK